MLYKAFIAAGARALFSFLVKKGLPGGLALALGFIIRILFSETDTEILHMMPSGSGEGGRSFRWTDLFGSFESSNSEASVNQPATDYANPGEPDAPIYHPLQEDGQRRQELSDRLGINCIGSSMPDEVRESIIQSQISIELKIEKALRSDRFSEDSLMEKRHQIRGVLLYPNGKAFSLRTYNKHLHYMENFGTHRSVPYKRVMTALYNKELELEKN